MGIHARGTSPLRAGVRAAMGAVLLVGLGAAFGGCLTRKVSNAEPSTKVNYKTRIRQSGVDKIDLLFSIDNSASMGDKQTYLSQAIPDLVKRLTTPNCVDFEDDNKVVGISHDNGTCDQGKVEFPPVHDLHVAIVSSSLGMRGGNVCRPADTIKIGGRELNRHNDDQAHLLNRGTEAETPVANAGTSHFLSWLPDVDANKGRVPGSGSPAIKVSTTLEKDFSDLVTGVNAYGCGIESQLESWYRFLVQPDPYDSIEVVGEGEHAKATWNGVDATILKQRRDFLRPDSLVAVVVLTDENDSEIDVRAANQTAFNFMRDSFDPPRGTSACAANPNDPNCTSCAFLHNRGAGDPSCDKGDYTALEDWGKDTNLRHVHMKAKYGFDPQFPISRYVTGLTSKLVPDRTGEYPPAAGSYVGEAKCRNPLFAASLPDGSSLDPNTLCNAAPGPRTDDLIFFAHIGGVPHQLLHFNPDDPQASILTDHDWVKILGAKPEEYNYEGIDPHMIESVAPRKNLPGPGSANDADAYHGREWITDQGPGINEGGHILKVDRQFACTFPLAKPRDCTKPENQSACDCPSKPVLSHEQTPPVCNPNKQTEQIAAKAYPTIRELLLARKMEKQGIVSSICPIHVEEKEPGDRLYGYRPAVEAIVHRLKDALAETCIPQPLEEDDDGTVPCLVLELLPAPGDQATACNVNGREQPDPSVLRQYRVEQEKNEDFEGMKHPLCAVKQLKNAELVDHSCEKSAGAGWCYVTRARRPKERCAQAIKFSKEGSPRDNTLVTLACIQPPSIDAGR